MKQHLLDIIKIGRKDNAVQVSFNNGAERVFIDFEPSQDAQLHYIGNTEVAFSDAFDHLAENVDHIESIA